ncbi:uncharacterized protein KRP23_13344 [Phytophthora ramorum]|uniref:uncharacterized protein n=1 Tax=Phytophthora ramorum TaxID=164328 RepID=UPI003094A45F|nr:hypothetical protein KRP23_13344 [Phytophthora ramorum]
MQHFPTGQAEHKRHRRLARRNANGIYNWIMTNDVFYRKVLAHLKHDYSKLEQHARELEQANVALEQDNVDLRNALLAKEQQTAELQREIEAQTKASGACTRRWPASNSFEQWLLFVEQEKQDVETLLARYKKKLQAQNRIMTEARVLARELRRSAESTIFNSSTTVNSWCSTFERGIAHVIVAGELYGSSCLRSDSELIYGMSTLEGLETARRGSPFSRSS